MPTNPSPGVTSPAVLGPMIRVPVCARRRAVASRRCAGMCSVKHDEQSRAGLACRRSGLQRARRRHEQHRDVESDPAPSPLARWRTPARRNASCRPSTEMTPATTFVPQPCIRSVQNVPCSPGDALDEDAVDACAMITGAASTAARTASSMTSKGRMAEPVARPGRWPRPRRCRGSRRTPGQRGLQLLPRGDDARGHHVGAGERAAEVDERLTHARVVEHERQRRLGLGVGVAADLQEVRRAGRRSGGSRPWWPWSARRRWRARRPRRRVQCI